MPISGATFVRTTLALLLVGLFSLLGIVAASLWETRLIAADTVELGELEQIRAGVVTLFSLVQDAETGQRGYLLTREAAYLEPYSVANAGLAKALDRLRRRVRGRADLEARVAHLADLIQLKRAELDETVELARAGRQGEAMDVVHSDRGKRAMEGVRSAVREMLTSLDGELAAKAVEMRIGGQQLTWTLLLGGVAILVVVGGSTWLAWRYTRDLERARLEVGLLNATLEQRVRERTSDLARANEEVQRFAYIVSHDLRSPLVNVMGFTGELETGVATLRAFLDEQADTAQDSPTTKAARFVVEADMPEAIGFIRSSTAKMDRLINAILKLSREGARILNPTKVDVAGLFEAAAASVRHQMKEHGGEIEVIEPIPPVIADRLALEQVFGNLVDNAVKYLDPQRPGRIVIRGRQDGTRVEYEVADNGRGIAPEDHERIFELFRRSGLQDQPGEGIGLSHVQALVRRLGGEITLQSQLGQGTTFRVRLPREPQGGKETT